VAAPILPTADSLLTPAINAIVAQRPEALAHFNSDGRWTNLTKMWRGQAMVNLARMADEIKSRRLRLAVGDALRALCASEFSTSLPPEPQLSYATIVLNRPSGGPSGILRAGASTQFVKVAKPNGIPLPAANAYPGAIAAATYNVLAPVYVPASGSSQNVTVQCVAVSPGSAANVPLFTNSGYAAPTTIQPSNPLFDTNLVVASAVSSGGSSGLTDDVLRTAARAYNQGSFGPTDGAVIAALLGQQSVRHYAIFPANGYLDYAQIYVADESWASTTQWVSQVAQNFADNWQGFGCRARFGTVSNLHIAISANIVLASTDALNYTAQIDDNVRAAAESYFNDRSDWYTWRTKSLQATLSSADPRILYCSSVTVSDAATNGTLSDPVNSFAGSSVFQTAWSPTVTHYYLLDQGVTTAYFPPSQNPT
jgi:hypothetical protein